MSEDDPGKTLTSSWNPSIYELEQRIALTFYSHAARIYPTFDIKEPGEKLY